MREYTIIVHNLKRDGDAFVEDKAAGRVELIGMDPGSAAVEAYNPRTKTLTWKMPGHSYWTGVGQPSRYAPTEIVVAVLDAEPLKGKRLKARVLIAWMPGKGRG